MRHIVELVPHASRHTGHAAATPNLRFSQAERPRPRRYVRHHAVSLLSLTMLSFGAWYARLVHTFAGALSSLCLLIFHGGASLAFALAWSSGAIPAAKVLLPHAPLALGFAALAIAPGSPGNQPLSPWRLHGALTSPEWSTLSSVQSRLPAAAGPHVPALWQALMLSHAALELGLGALKLRGRYAHEPPVDAPGGRGARGAMYVRHHGCALLALATLGLGLWAADATPDSGGGRIGAALAAQLSPPVTNRGAAAAPASLAVMRSPFGALVCGCLLLLHGGAVAAFACTWAGGAIPARKVIVPHAPFAVGFAALVAWQWASAGL